MEVHTTIHEMNDTIDRILPALGLYREHSVYHGSDKDMKVSHIVTLQKNVSALMQLLRRHEKERNILLEQMGLEDQGLAEQSLTKAVEDMLQKVACLETDLAAVKREGVETEERCRRELETTTRNHQIEEMKHRKWKTAHTNEMLRLKLRLDQYVSKQSTPPDVQMRDRSVQAVILPPTRECCIQVDIGPGFQDVESSKSSDDSQRGEHRMKKTLNSLESQTTPKENFQGSIMQESGKKASSIDGVQIRGSFVWSHSGPPHNMHKDPSSSNRDDIVYPRGDVMLNLLDDAIQRPRNGHCAPMHRLDKRQSTLAENFTGTASSHNPDGPSERKPIPDDLSKSTTSPRGMRSHWAREIPDDLTETGRTKFNVEFALPGEKLHECSTSHKLPQASHFPFASKSRSSRKSTKIRRSHTTLSKEVLSSGSSTSQCLRCHKVYRHIENNKAACKYHPKGKQTIERYDDAGRLVKISQVWECCQLISSAQGCHIGEHV